MTYDDGPLDDVPDDEPKVYSGKIFWVHIQDNKPLVAFPEWYSTIVLGDDSLVPCRHEDLKAGMAIQVLGNVGLIEKVEEGLWHGLMDGVFLGEQQTEDYHVPRKEFVREIFEDGRLNWKMVGLRRDRCPACDRPL